MVTSKYLRSFILFQHCRLSNYFKLRTSVFFFWQLPVFFSYPINNIIRFGVAERTGMHIPRRIHIYTTAAGKTTHPPLVIAMIKHGRIFIIRRRIINGFKSFFQYFNMLFLQHHILSFVMPDTSWFQHLYKLNAEFFCKIDVRH